MRHLSSTDQTIKEITIPKVVDYTGQIEKPNGVFEEHKLTLIPKGFSKEVLDAKGLHMAGNGYNSNGVAFSVIAGKPSGLNGRQTYFEAMPIKDGELCLSSERRISKLKDLYGILAEMTPESIQDDQDKEWQYSEGGE